MTVSTALTFEVDELNFKKLSKNLRMLLDKNNVTESKIAQSLNIPVMTVRRLVSGETTDPRISTLKLIADYFNVSVDSLMKDNNPETIAQMSKIMPQFIPVLNWRTLTDVNSIAEIDLKSWTDWYPIVLGSKFELSKDAFALESRPSMQPRFPIKTLFIIDPTISHNDGDIVLIKMQSSGDLSLRELIIDLPRWQLQSVIIGSETLYYNDKEHQIMGVVVLTMLRTRKESASG